MNLSIPVAYFLGGQRTESGWCCLGVVNNAFNGKVLLVLMDNSVGERFVWLNEDYCLVGIVRPAAERAFKFEAAVSHSHFSQSV